MTHDIVRIASDVSIKAAVYAIEHSPFDEAFIITEGGAYLGAVHSTDLRRLLISGANEIDAVGAYPPKCAVDLSKVDLHDERRLRDVAADLRLAGFRHVPIVSDDRVIVDVAAIEDLVPTEAGPEAMKRILVVGGAGYLGSVLTRKLIGHGYGVRVLDKFLYGRRALDDIASDRRLEVVEGDMRDIHTCVSALEGVHGVVVLAAIVGDPASSVRPTETIETNVLATQALASACKLQHIARFVYASTCSVYGVGAEALDEQSPLNPVSLYARTKIASEQMVLGLGDDYFCPTVLRMGTLYGDSPRMRFDLVVNTMAMKSFTDKKIQVFGGKQWRPLLHVEDAADVYVACLEADLSVVGNQVFNVGSDAQNYEIDQIADLVSASLGNVPIEHDGSSLDARDYRVSFKKIQAAVGFEPRGSIAAAAKAIYAKLERGVIKDPAQKVYYNHYFDSSEE